MSVIKLTNPKIAELSAKHTFTLESLACDTSGTYFSNHEKVCLLLESWAKTENNTLAFHPFFLRGAISLRVALVNLRIYWREIHKTDAVKKVVALNKEKIVKLPTYTNEEIELLAVTLLIGNDHIIEHIGETILLIWENILHKTDNPYPTALFNIMFSSLDLFESARTGIPLYEIKANGLTVSCVTFEPTLVKKVEDLLKISFIIEISENNKIV